jgi:signal transduction histidine kinase
MFYLTNDPQKILLLSTYKGWFYVVVTGVLLYYLIRNEISRRNLITALLVEAKKKAEESDRLKSTFLANLSHYIRTPMNGILGFVELLEDKDTSPENHQLFLNFINEQSRNLLQTINSIIEISRIQEGQEVVNFSSFSINELIHSVVETVKLEMNDKVQQLEIKEDCELFNGNDSIRSDREKVFQVLSNLMTNAIKFTAAGKVTIGYYVSMDSITVWVEDTGKGVPENRKELIFKEFLYTNSLTNTINEGAGLGLPLSAGLAKLLGGHLWLEATSSSGSVFCLKIPHVKNNPIGNSQQG